MTTADKMLDRMKNNPLDWHIADLLAVAERNGMEVRNSGGSHHVISAEGIAESLCVPAHRPVKLVYVRRFTAMIDAIKEKTL